MNAPIDLKRMTPQKFGVGQPVSRKEDPKLLRGQGRYSDDMSMPGQLSAVMVRSRYAHGRVVAVDTEAARAMAGVALVITARDFTSGGYGEMPGSSPAVNRDGSPVKKPPQLALASDKVRYVGEPIACVVAETLQQARDGAEAVTVEIDALPAVTDARAGAYRARHNCTRSLPATSSSISTTATPKK